MAKDPVQNVSCNGPAAVDGGLRRLQTLAGSKVYEPLEQRAALHQTVVIFDWDDTLLCTTFLNRLDQLEALQAVDEARLALVEQIGEVARVLLEEAMEVGQVFIITNAEEGWVQHSAARWAPALLPTLEKVTVVSARSRYERRYPDEVGQWKIMAFLDVQKELRGRIVTNLISLGDSNFEVRAAHVLRREFKSSFIKTIKFRENPTPEELLKQLELVKQQFQRIALTARCLKISLNKTPSPGASPIAGRGVVAMPAKAEAVAVA